MLYKCWADVTLKSGDTLELTPDDFTATGNYINESADKSDIPYGAIYTKSAHLQIINSNDAYIATDFTEGEIVLKTKIGTETIQLGVFYVIEHYNYGGVIELSAVDATYKLNKVYVPTISFPALSRVLYEDITEQCGIETGAPPMLPGQAPTYVNKPLDGMTCREIVQELAELCWSAVYMNEDNTLQTQFFTTAALDTPEYATWKADSFQFEFNEQEITGVRAKVVRSDNSVGEVLFGDETGVVYNFNLSFAFISQSLFESRVAPYIIGKTFRRFSGQSLESEFAEYAQFPGKMIHVLSSIGTEIELDFYTYLTNYNIEFLGACTIESAINNDNSDYSSSAQTEARDVAADSINRNQGSENAGKVLVVGEDGSATPQVFIKRTVVNVTTEANTHVSPFSAFAAIQKSDTDADGYDIIGIVPLTGSTTVVSTHENAARNAISVYSNTPATFDIVIYYIDVQVFT